MSRQPPRARSDVSALQEMLRGVCTRELGYPRAAWWGPPGMPARRLYLSENRPDQWRVCLLFEGDGTSLERPRVQVDNAKDENERREAAEFAFAAFKRAIEIGPEGPAIARDLERAAAELNASKEL